jgi:hypothetical protein
MACQDERHCFHESRDQSINCQGARLDVPTPCSRMPRSSKTVGFTLPHCMSPVLAVRPEGANHQWRRNPPGELSIDPVADERLMRVTAWVGAS